MQYHELTLRIPAADVETASAIANLVVPYGIYIEDYSDIEEMAPKIAHVDLIEQELLDRDRTVADIHIYIPQEENLSEAIAFLTERFRAAGITCAVSQAAVDEQDWSTAWKKYYFPTKVGQRLVVVPSWEHYEKAPEEITITMDPGMAFGTGTHDTTRLCMTLLEDTVTPGAKLLDIGTGSGILAIAALLLGASDAVGIDIDEVAVRVAGENAAANGVTAHTQFLCGDLAEKVNGKFDVITANIVADVIIRFAPDLMRFMTASSRFIASGIIDTREADVRLALESAGLRVLRREGSAGWVALLCAL